MEMIEHPLITKMERDGFIDVPDTFECPVCGAEIYDGDTVYISYGDVVGCVKCIRKEEAWEVLHGTH